MKFPIIITSCFATYLLLHRFVYIPCFDIFDIFSIVAHIFSFQSPIYQVQPCVCWISANCLVA